MSSYGEELLVNSIPLFLSITWRTYISTCNAFLNETKWLGCVATCGSGAKNKVKSVPARFIINSHLTPTNFWVRGSFLVAFVWSAL